MAITSPNITVNLGTIPVAQRRRDTYEKEMKRAGFDSLGAWVKAVLDKEAGFKE